ncbi:MAG TPA: ATP-dependent helicase, partial [Ktedonobacteraceae bacterium]|nr:ATP-dependent helicase [Ktedonobacteraceae bacterium]
QAAIEAPTPALIVAGPGSGKTSTLIGRASYLIKQQEIPATQLLALTFSRKAAEEMQQRLQQELGLENELPLVSTFHAYCAEVLRKHGHYMGLRPDFRLLDETEGYFILREVCSQLSLQHYRNLKFPPQHFPNILKAISRAKDELVTPEDYATLAAKMEAEASDSETQEAATQAKELALIYHHYEEALQHQGDTDFGGLIMQTIQLFDQAPEALQAEQEQYIHILVDEFQDINRASGILLQRLAGKRRQVWVVGDANQAIYGFRGASPANISNFKHEYPGATILPLSRNYRSRPDIVAFAEAFRQGKMEGDTPEGATKITNEAARPNNALPYLTLATAEDEAGELAGIIGDIHRKLAEGYMYRDIVVLCRTRNHMRKVTRALSQAGLPLIERGEMLEQNPIKNLLGLLLLCAESSGMGLLRVARIPMHSLKQADIEALLLTAHQKKVPPLDVIKCLEYPDSISSEGKTTLSQLAATMKSLGHALNTWSLIAQYLFNETTLARELITHRQLGDNQAQLQDYATLLKVAQTYDQRQQAIFYQAASEADEQGLEPPVPPGLQEQIRGFLDYLNVLITLRQDIGGRPQASEQAEAGEEPDIIRVMTVHASKGLEFPVVYLPGIAHNRVPSIYRPSGIAAPAGMLPPNSEGKPFHEAGEASLFYVAITRAKEHLIVSHSLKYGKLSYKPSTFIDTLLNELQELPPARITQIQWKASAVEIIPQPVSDDEELVVDDDTPLLQPDEAFIAAMSRETLNNAEIETYRQCPRRYLYSNVYRFQREGGPYQFFQQAMTQTIKALPNEASKASEEQPEISREQIHELFLATWNELGGKEQPFAQMYEQHGREVIEQLWQTLKNGEIGFWDTQNSLMAEIEGHRVRVNVDRVESFPSRGAEEGQDKPSAFVRTNFGKSKEIAKPKEREWLYQEAYRQRFPGHEPVMFSHNLSTGEIVPISISSRS